LYRALQILVVIGAFAACSSPPEETPGNNGATNGGTTGVATCDPALDESCRLEIALDEQPCSFDGHAPGDIPSLTAGDPESVVDTDVVAAAYADGWILANADGRITDGATTLGERPDTRVLGLAAASSGIALSHFSRDTGEVAVEYLPADGQWREVLRIEVGEERPGGGIALQDDGTLWIAIGDGGRESTARDPSTLAGSLLRVDVSSDPYTIPDDNPYADDPVRLPEIWATGLRNPTHCAVSGTEVWCSDVGELYVELNRAKSGADYGWPFADGPGCRQTSCPEDQTGPVAFRLASEECDLLPGPMMPASIPDAENAHVYAGVCNGRLLGVRSTPDGVRQTRRIGLTSGEVAGIAATGEAVLTMSTDGTERRWTFTDDLDAFPRRLAESGCLTEEREFGPTLLPYEIASPLWTDGAHKERYFALPVGEKITMADDGRLELPDGSAILKMFSRELADGTMRPIETRVMRQRNGEWDFYTYAWEGGEAQLLSGSAEVHIEDPADGEAYDHHIPSRAACQSCHLSSKRVLGPVGQQLGRNIDLKGRLAGQLELFRQAGVLEGSTGRERLVDPFDATASLEKRARSYLHANCAHCHRPGGWAPASLEMDLRYDTPLADTGVCDVPAGFGKIWADGDVRIDPGAPENSNLLQRMLVDNMGRMPPIGVSVPDTRGAAVVEDWIANLEGCQ
jgi:uncharacterized repeat protein (TIGR03806 family)